MNEQTEMNRPWQWILMAVVIAWCAFVVSAMCCEYDPEQCNWMVKNMDPAFAVPAGGVVTNKLDMRSCGVTKNFVVAVLNERRRWPAATIEVFNDVTGERFGTVSANRHLWNAPNPLYGSRDCIVLRIVVSAGGNRDERCILQYAGTQ